MEKDHYPHVTAALRATLSDTLQDDYTPEVQKTWEDVSVLIEGAMISDNYDNIDKDFFKKNDVWDEINSAFKFRILPNSYLHPLKVGYVGPNLINKIKDK